MNDGTRSEAVATDPLFLGLTRPAMFWGVPQPYFVVNGMVSMLGFLWSGSFGTLLVLAPAVHVAGYLACLRDARIFEICLSKARLAPCRNRRYWRARTYDPFR